MSLFPIPVKFCPFLDAKIPGERPAKGDCDCLASEGKEYDIICHEKQVQIAFGVAGVIRG